MANGKYLSHHEVVRTLIETKAVDFNAVGKAVAELGPSLALSDDPWENFCGTMRMFIRLYRLPWPGPRSPLENLGGLGAVARDVQGQG